MNNTKNKEFKNFNDVKNFIFKELKKEMEDVRFFHSSGVLNKYIEESIKYNKLYYTFNKNFFKSSPCNKKIKKYGYTPQEIEQLIYKISIRTIDATDDTKLMFTILERRKLNYNFTDIFDIKILKDDTQALQVKYDNLNLFKKFWYYVNQP